MIWAALALLIFLILVWGWFSSNLVLHVSRLPLEDLPSDHGVAFDTVTFATTDGILLSGWWVPAAHSCDTTIVLCHGWGANRGDILEKTIFLNKEGGYNLLFFDFRNHGNSEGKRSSLGALESLDFEAALSFLKKQKPEASKHLAVLGYSMGGAVALYGAAHHPEIRAVVAESSFSSFNEVVARFAKLLYHIPRYPFLPLTLFFVRARLQQDPESFSPIQHIHKIAPRPLFLIQGDQDDRMPLHEGERLLEAAGEPKTLWTVKGADHGEVSETANHHYEKKILEFFKKNLPS